MEKKVVVAGHISLDITPAFLSRTKKDLSEIFSPGKLIRTGNAAVHVGGVVSNTGLALKKLGCDVRLVGMVGNDNFGKMILNILSSFAADKDILVNGEHGTSYTIVIAPPGIDRIFFHGPGVNDVFSETDLFRIDLSKTALLHFGYPPLMRRMYEDGGIHLAEICKYVQSSGAAMSLDLAAVDPDAPEGKADWRQILSRVLPLVDFFVPSVEELCFMLDRPRYNAWVARACGKDVTEILDVEEDLCPLAGLAMELGAKVLMLKCGAKGIYYQTACAKTLEKISPRVGLDVNIWTAKTGFQKSFIPDRVLSGTGAGDTSIAAFLCAVLEGYSPEKCVQLAAAEGASCVEALDSISGLRTLDELEEKISEGWATT